MAQTLVYGHPLEDLLGQGGQGGWNPLQYRRPYGDPKTKAFFYGKDRVDLAWRYATSPRVLRPEVLRLVPLHWWGVVFDVLRQCRVEMRMNGNLPWVYLTGLSYGFGSSAGFLPRYDNTLGTRFGKDLALSILKAAVPAQGIVQPETVLREAGGMVAEYLERGTHMAFHGHVEEAARFLAGALAPLGVATIASLILSAMTDSSVAGANRVSRSNIINEWMSRLPSPIGISQELGDQVRRSRDTILVSRAEAKGAIFFELSVAGFRATPSDALPSPVASTKYMAELQRMNQTMLVTRRQPPPTEGPLLYGAGRSAGTPPNAGGLLSIGEPLLAAIDGLLFPISFPDLADFCVANVYDTTHFHWPHASGRAAGWSSV